MVIVRAATQQDAAAIAHVHIESWRTTYAGIVSDRVLASLNEERRTVDWREWLTHDIECFVAVENGAIGDGEIVGFTSGGPVREPIGNYDAELYAMYLLKHAQGRGTGTALLKALAAALQCRNFKSMAAWVLVGNASSHFYQKTGAQPISNKEVDMAGVMLPVIAYGWPDLKSIIRTH